MPKSIIEYAESRAYDRMNSSCMYDSEVFTDFVVESYRKALRFGPSPEAMKKIKAIEDQLDRIDAIGDDFARIEIRLDELEKSGKLPSAVVDAVFRLDRAAVESYVRSLNATTPITDGSKN